MRVRELNTSSVLKDDSVPRQESTVGIRATSMHRMREPDYGLVLRASVHVPARVRLAGVSATRSYQLPRHNGRDFKHARRLSGTDRPTQPMAGGRRSVHGLAQRMVSFVVHLQGYSQLLPVRGSG